MARDTGWFKSSFSGSGSDSCLEARITGNTVYLRDTKNRCAGMLQFPAASWAALTSGLVERDTH